MIKNNIECKTNFSSRDYRMYEFYKRNRRNDGDLKIRTEKMVNFLVRYIKYYNPEDNYQYFYRKNSVNR